MSYPKIIERLKKGESVELYPSGNSMTPRIKSKQRIVLAPIGDQLIEVGEIVLAKVKGRYYIHLVTAIDKHGRAQISNNHNHVNGIASQVYGRVVEIG